jgi:hypothetical protein
MLPLGLEASLLGVLHVWAPSCLQGGSGQGLTMSVPPVPARLRLRIWSGIGPVSTRLGAPGLAATSVTILRPTDSQPSGAGCCSMLRLRLHVAVD